MTCIKRRDGRKDTVVAQEEKYTEALKLTPKTISSVVSSICDGADDVSLLIRYEIAAQQLLELREWWRDDLNELYQWSVDEADNKYGRGRAYSLGYAEGVTEVYVQVYQNIRKHPECYELESLFTWRVLIPDKET